MLSKYVRLLQEPEQSFFLLGLRGGGKSTWAREAFPGASWMDLLDQRLYQDLLADASLFAQSIQHRPPGSWVVVDEVQRLPALLNEVHRLIESRRLRFALLGSSARKLRSAGVNLLAGRALLRTMFPLTAAELGDDFELDRVLRFGSLPLIWTNPRPREVLEAWVLLYLQEEIRAEAAARNLPGFARFLPVAALMNGQAINGSGIARDAGVARTTVQGYLGILEDTLLVHRLPAYDSRLRVRERRAPKLYWVDPGIVRAVKRQFGEPAAEERGALLESWVLTTLRAHAVEAELYDSLFFWASHQRKSEVDFLLERDGELLGVEVKATDRYHTGLLKGLRVMGPLPGVVRRVLVYTGERPFRSADGIEIWPARHFAERVAAGDLWP